MRLRSSLASLVLVCLGMAVQAGTPLFDAHLHDNAVDGLPPHAVLETLERNGVSRAAVTSTPPERVLDLHRLAPARIVPFLGVYRSPADKETWHGDESLPARVETALHEGPWRGVGELHLFADARHSPVFRRIVELVAARGLILLLHADPAVIDAVFEQAPAARVIWAHAGAYPYPPLLNDYLRRYPGLYADLSMRDERIAPGGQLDPSWESLLLEWSGRFLVGVDTFSLGRWRDYDGHVGQIRSWLAQLPNEVAMDIAYRNAQRLFPNE